MKKKLDKPLFCPSCRREIAVSDQVCPYCGRKNPGMWGLTVTLQNLGYDLGFRALVTWGCIGVYLATLLVEQKGELSPSRETLLLFGATGFIPVYEQGHWWTTLSVAWLHANILHLAFNLFLIRQLIPVVASIFGAGRTVIIYTFAAITGSLLTSSIRLIAGGIPVYWQGADVLVGASGAMFGLFGCLVAYRQIVSGNIVGQYALVWTILLLLIGFILPFVDNWGHIGGFLGGYVLAKVGWLGPHFPEQQSHLLVAIACLILSLLSIFTSISR